MSRLLWVRCVEQYHSHNHLSAARSGRSAGDSNQNSSHWNSYHWHQGMTAGISTSDHGRQQRKPSCTLSSDSYQGMPSGTLSSDSYQGMPSGIPQRAKKNFGFSRWKSQLEQVLKVTDLLLQSNGFGMIALDLSDVPVESARRIPLASWFRFRRAVEHSPTALLVMEQQPIAGSCSSLVLKVSSVRAEPTNPAAHSLPHSKLLDQFEISAQILCSRLEKRSERKATQTTTSFKSWASWVG